VWIEDAVTAEHLERAVLQHIDDAHPEYRLIARHALKAGLHPLPLFDTVAATDECATTTCVCCGASIVIEPADPESPLLQSFMSEHVARHADAIREERT
jgi:hypothetical protein